MTQGEDAALKNEFFRALGPEATARLLGMTDEDAQRAIDLAIATVQSLRWLDVSDECEVECSSVKGWRIFHKGADVLVESGYRLRKVEDIVQAEGGPLNPHVAFIVEKQE